MIDISLGTITLGDKVDIGRIHYTLDDKNIKMYIETIPLFNEEGEKV